MKNVVHKKHLKKKTLFQDLFFAIKNEHRFNIFDDLNDEENFAFGSHFRCDTLRSEQQFGTKLTSKTV